jgi:hypothetical protein
VSSQTQPLQSGAVAARSTGSSSPSVNHLLTIACVHYPIIISRFPPGSLEEKPMSVEILTYGALGARLNISPEAARSFAKRHRLPRSLSDDGRALVSVDLAEVRHTPQPPVRRQGGDTDPLMAKIVALQAEVAALEARSAGHRADFEHERERADRLMAELLQATAETTAAREATARLEGEVAALRTVVRIGSSDENHGHSARRVGHVAASLVEADRKAARG